MEGSISVSVLGETGAGWWFCVNRWTRCTVKKRGKKANKLTVEFSDTFSVLSIASAYSASVFALWRCACSSSLSLLSKHTSLHYFSSLSSRCLNTVLKIQFYTSHLSYINTTSVPALLFAVCLVILYPLEWFLVNLRLSPTLYILTHLPVC